MKKPIDVLVIVPRLLAIAAIVNLRLCGLARAEPAQQFTFRVTSPRPGSLSVHVRLRRFDTTGAVPQAPTAFALRLPRGVKLTPPSSPRATCATDGRCATRSMRIPPGCRSRSGLSTSARSHASFGAAARSTTERSCRTCSHASVGGSVVVPD